MDIAEHVWHAKIETFYVDTGNYNFILHLNIELSIILTLALGLCSKKEPDPLLRTIAYFRWEHWGDAQRAWKANPKCGSQSHSWQDQEEKRIHSKWTNRTNCAVWSICTITLKLICLSFYNFNGISIRMAILRRHLTDLIKLKRLGVPGESCGVDCISYMNNIWYILWSSKFQKLWIRRSNHPCHQLIFYMVESQGPRAGVWLVERTNCIA